MAFDPKRPNVVIFGDSNTWVFGPAFREQIVAKRLIPAEQVLIKYRSGSKPSQWLAGHPKRLWTGAAKFKGPAVADALSPATALVVIGLGGNMGTGEAGRASVVELLEQVEAAAPKARIVWRGVPPSTRKKSGKLASKKTKLKRYILNYGLLRTLAPRGFRILDLDGLDEAWGPGDRRVYIDLISLHACGPASSTQKKIGTAKDLDYERNIVASAPKAHLVSLDVERGPWVSFVAARDNAIPSHVPRDAARELVEIVDASGALALGPGAPPQLPPKPELSQRYRVIDARALIRQGPPKFRSTGKIIALGTLVRVEAREGDNARVYGVDGRDYGWTHAANLAQVEAPALESVERSRHEQPLVVHRDVYTIVDDGALVHEGPPGFGPVRPLELIPVFTRVRVDRTEGPFARVRAITGEDIGWTQSSKLRLLLRDVGALQAAPLRPTDPVAVPSKGIAKQLAQTYNRLGGLMERLADELKLDTATILAVWALESKDVVELAEGCRHGAAGCRSARELAKTLQSGERAQLLVLFDVLTGYSRTMIRYLRAHDWARFGSKYKGSATYGLNKLRPRFEAAQQVLAARV